LTRSVARWREQKFARKNKICRNRKGVLGCPPISTKPHPTSRDENVSRPRSHSCGRGAARVATYTRIGHRMCLHSPARRRQSHLQTNKNLDTRGAGFVDHHAPYVDHPKRLVTHGTRRRAVPGRDRAPTGDRPAVTQTGWTFHG